MIARTLVSTSDYLTTVYEPECDYVDGELIERNVGELDHSGLQMIIAAILYNQRREAGIHVFPELRVQVAPTRFRVPDITVTKQPGRGRILRETPFLCVEILSPEDRASRMEARIDDYLTFGVPHVWVIDPQRRKAWSYSKEGKREASNILTTRDPALSLVLEEVFFELDKDVKG